jgi:hypothetical protein
MTMVLQTMSSRHSKSIVLGFDCGVETPDRTSSYFCEFPFGFCDFILVRGQLILRKVQCSCWPVSFGASAGYGFKAEGAPKTYSLGSENVSAGAAKQEGRSADRRSQQRQRRKRDSSRQESGLAPCRALVAAPATAGKVRMTSEDVVVWRRPMRSAVKAAAGGRGVGSGGVCRRGFWGVCL